MFCMIQAAYYKILIRYEILIDLVSNCMIPVLYISCVLESYFFPNKKSHLMTQLTPFYIIMYRKWYSVALKLVRFHHCYNVQQV